MTAIDTSTEAVERLLDGVTPGPWELRHNMAEDEVGEYAEGVSVVANGRFYVHEHDICFGDDVDALIEANARFIAAARQLVPALLKERDDLRAKLAVAAEALKHYRETLCEGFCKGDVWADEGHSHPDIQRDCGGCLAASVLINCAALESLRPTRVTASNAGNDQ